MSEKSVQLSAREMEVLALAWQCMESQPKIDISKLAALTGYTPGSASVTFGIIKRKIKLLGEGLAANGPAAPKNGTGAGKAKSTPRSSVKRKPTTAAAGSDEHVSRTKRPTKNSATKPRRHVDDDDEELTTCGKIKQEELNDMTACADSDFYTQVQHAAAGGYGLPDEFN